MCTIGWQVALRADEDNVRFLSQQELPQEDILVLFLHPNIVSRLRFGDVDKIKKWPGKVITPIYGGIPRTTGVWPVVRPFMTAKAIDKGRY